MKPQENQLVTEISKLQCMVSELKTGFTSALLELSQIQHGDTYLREELEENRRSCQKKALRLEALVESLREELSLVQRQILQLNSHRQKPQQQENISTPKHRESTDAAETSQSVCTCPSTVSRGKLLLHCFLQGLKAGLSEGTDARHQVAMQLLHSEWEYVSTLNQLYDQYRTPPAHHMAVEPYQRYLKFVEQLLQRHLLFRNTLQERLSAEHWKSLVGDILVQLIGQNDTAFSDMYLGYTTSLASFLQLEFNRLNHPEEEHKVQMDREEMKLLSLLLAPVSRIHSYLSHIQNLLQWTGKEHPDCSLLLGTERALRTVLSRCHVILEEDVRWDEREAAGQSGCSDAAAASSSANCCSRIQQSREPQRNSEDTAHRDIQNAGPLTNGVDVHQSMRLECWSCSPVRRKTTGRDWTSVNQPARDCEHVSCSVLTPDTAGWTENSDSGQGTFSQPTGKSTNGLDPASSATQGLQYCDTDADDTSAFDYSSVTSCSPDGTLQRGMTGSVEEDEEEEEEEEEEDEEDSQVPVLLKPTYNQKQQQQQSSSSRDVPRERTVCLRWQIPRLTPHPPLRSTPGSCVDRSKPCLVSSHGKRLVSVRKGSPPLHPKSAFRPIWDDPSKQLDSAPEKDNRPGFVPIQAPTRQSAHTFTLSRDTLRPGRAPQHDGNHVTGMNGGGLWEDSEDSEGPCSTV